jgi:uncharacterized protein YndB with AHSA1/START domain
MIGNVGIASESVRVDFPIEDVFDFLVDGTNNSLWRPEVTRVIFAAGPPERAVWAQTVTTPDGKTHKADYRISWYDHPGKLELTVFNGPARPTTTFELRSLTAQSTHVTCTVDLKPLGYPFERTRFGTAQAGRYADQVRALGAAMAARPRRR